MKTQTTSSLHFQRKISDFCDVRIAPIVSRRALENIRPYLTSLVIYRKHPPMRTGRIDWQSVSDACGLDGELTAGLKMNLQAGLEAITRWIDSERSKEVERSPSARKARSPAGASHLPIAKKKTSSQTRAAVAFLPAPAHFISPALLPIRVSATGSSSA